MTNNSTTIYWRQERCAMCHFSYMKSILIPTAMAPCRTRITMMSVLVIGLSERARVG